MSCGAFSEASFFLFSWFRETTQSTIALLLPMHFLSQFSHSQRTPFNHILEGHFQPNINLLQLNSLILLNLPYGPVVDNYVRDRCHITLSLYKTDTSLRRTVEAGPEGVRLREV